LPTKCAKTVIAHIFENCYQLFADD